MTVDALADKYEQIGNTSSADTLSSSPIGTKGTPIPGPYPAGSNGDQPPPADQQLDYYVINAGTPA